MQNVVAEKLKNIAATPKVKKDDASPNSVDNMAFFFEYLPSYEEYANNGEDCETSYAGCQLF